MLLIIDLIQLLGELKFLTKSNRLLVFIFIIIFMVNHHILSVIPYNILESRPPFFLSLQPLSSTHYNSPWLRPFSFHGKISSFYLLSLNHSIPLSLSLENILELSWGEKNLEAFSSFSPNTPPTGYNGEKQSNFLSTVYKIFKNLIPTTASCPPTDTDTRPFHRPD